ncbi:Asp-tRNA(Asn)/Glu-tRNA(Gln) amidotransferase subunit GatB [Candidatus Kaiserbacteria bacterium]|nr:Asp-tRNA(Asn)/Glu-tRNA(Gln) amidotransferase subunit GatB [Candidatus Kaiserbacteria bacterium]
MDYVPTIGLEIHAELKTRTKMFCSSSNDPDEKRPNVNICPVCLAHPGTLPVINREAVRHVLRVGVALGGKLADYTEFDRKNYFYPDLPKGYQISQYEYPLVLGGELNGVTLTRVHLEEDTASSIHPEGKQNASYGAGDEGTTVIDFNRAGVPLMELVTEPVISSAAEAGAFARELQLLLRYLDASEANMEKGEMRVEANVSLGQKSKSKSQKLGTKVEIKNLNSFRAMERAVEYEIKRQKEVLERGERVVQETRGWDEGKQATFPQRSKEGSADYRYFPDPDLPALQLSELSELSRECLEAGLPELPWQRRTRYLAMGIKEEDARMLTAEPMLADFFDSVLKAIPSSVTPQMASNYTTNDLVKLIRDTKGRDSEYITDIPISARNFSIILQLIGEKKVSSRIAKDLLQESFSSDRDPAELATERSLFLGQKASDLSPIVEATLQKHAKVVEDYRAGKVSALQYLIGETMKATRGTADPNVLRELIISAIT